MRIIIKKQAEKERFSQPNLNQNSIAPPDSTPTITQLYIHFSQLIRKTVNLLAVGLP